MEWIKQHLILFLVLVVVIAGAVWYGMSGGGVSTDQSLIATETLDSTGSPSGDAEDRELVESLLTLRAITLTGTIFSDPAFQSLRDWGTPIVPEPVGRDNPFAPLPLSQSASVQSSQQGQRR